MDYIAHIRSESDNKEQPLIEHLENVSELCSSFAGCLNLSDYAKIIGTIHDIGKYSKEFQERIRGKNISVDHSSCGAREAIINKKPMAAFCIAGHHGGIPDFGCKSDTNQDITLIGRSKKKLCDYSDWKNEVVKPDYEKIVEPFGKDYLPYSFILRFLFSCLVDADFLDTEKFMSDGTVIRDNGDSISALLKMLENHIKKWENPQDKLNKLRTQMLNECIDAGKKSEDKIFTLTVPTGGGKTISSMAFALYYALKHNKKRIIYVIPYTSIIEQNAKVFRDIFGEKNVLEHHSNISFETESGDNEHDKEIKTQMRLASENWDCPIVVTTAVQFFESIFSNKPSKCRKIHNIADSVVIFDEAQMLPIDYLLPCVTAIRQLAENYNSAVVLCTATQPNLQTILNFTNGKNNKGVELTEVCKSAKNLTDDFRRVNFEYDGKLEDDELAARLNECSQVLCIVNKKAHAQKIYSMLDESDGNFHLSTYMYPDHRRRVLETIRQRLAENKPCRVVSTSLIEAGVDIDFPTVYRAISGIDSILQAGGRCNREGKRDTEESVVHIFDTDEILKYQNHNIDAARDVIKHYGNKIYESNAVKSYFDYLYYNLDIAKDHKVFDKKNIIKGLNNLEFKTVSEKFKMIEENTKTVYICTEDNEQEIDDLRKGNYSKELFRKLQHYAINLYDNDFEKIDNAGAIEYINGFYVLSDKDYYSDKTGVLFPDGKSIFIF